MTRPPPRSTLTTTLCPHTTRFRSADRAQAAVGDRPRLGHRRGDDRFGAVETMAAREERLDCRRNVAQLVRRQMARNQQAHHGQRHYRQRSEEHTAELQSLMRNSSAVFCLTNKKTL